MPDKKINTALISVYHKTGLDSIIKHLEEFKIDIYSTGGTKTYIESLGAKVKTVENLTSYPSILDGRVKTLHPKIFGGILARRTETHLTQLEEFEIPLFDLVVVDLYPFEETLKQTENQDEIIEKIDIGGISLIRAAAKNFNDVVVIPSTNQFSCLEKILSDQKAHSTLDQRIYLAKMAFDISSHYDTQIYHYFNHLNEESASLKLSFRNGQELRYGENPHQKGVFYGKLEEKFEILGGKPISYNNLVDIDSAVSLMVEFNEAPAFAVLKHTNSCGLAVRDNVFDAWKAALAGDPVSAFGAVLICNREIDLLTAIDIDKIFYEVLIAPEFSTEAISHLRKKKKRIILKIRDFHIPEYRIKSIMNGVLAQMSDTVSGNSDQFQNVTLKKPAKTELEEMIFADKCVKHLKSNAIAFTKNHQLLGMGCGQTSRVDACKQAIDKAIRMGFDLKGAVMASDAFFPFPDCVELANKAGVKLVIQPGGSIKDQLSIDYCNEHQMTMVFSGFRHFKH